jgi:hypothetical protein
MVKLGAKLFGFSVFVSLALHCSPRFAPNEPIAPNASKPGRTSRKGLGRDPGTQLIVGEMCPQSAGGQAGIELRMQKGVQWVDDAAELSGQAERLSATSFAVLGYDGKRAGVFAAMGALSGRALVAGSYVGAGPCTKDIGKNERSEDLSCSRAALGCGLAFAELPASNTNTPELSVGAACVEDGMLQLDIDGDGRAEQFGLEELLDGARDPAGEWLARAATSSASVTKSACVPSFSTWGLVIGRPDGKLGKIGDGKDGKYDVMLNIMGIVDLNADGRFEIIASLRYPDARSVVVYGASGTAGRLELAAESTSRP